VTQDSTNPDHSRIIVGLAGLHHLWSPTERQRYLAELIELGFRHFDVAPAYGNGIAERELGIACQRFHDVTIATKFGIAPLMYGDWARWLATPIRVVDRVSPGYRRRAERRSYGPLALRASVEGSLRRLRKHRLDYLLLHEPPPEQATSLLADVHGEVARLRAEGKIGAFGIAGEFYRIDEVATLDWLGIIQAPLNALHRCLLPSTAQGRAYFVHRAFVNSGASISFEKYLDQQMNERKDLQFIVGSRSVARLRPIAGLIR